MQQYNPNNPNQKFPVYDIRKVEQWNAGKIQLPVLNGTFVSEEPYAHFTIYFDRNLADFNNDGKIDFKDYSELANDFGKQDGNYITDISGPLGEPDGNVDMYDTQEFSENWLVE